MNLRIRRSKNRGKKMKIEIFFDESGKNETKPMIMGAISIPEKIYFLAEVQAINKQLQSKNENYHFTKYNGDYGMKNRIIELFKVLSPNFKLMRGNIIKYDNKGYKDKNDNTELFETMVYSKFPERVFYGLLRCKGNLMNIEANIFMEEASEYKDFPKQFKEQLNIQSLYRGEKFKIINCSMVPKYTEIGVELVDIILGIIRVILNFEDIETASKSKRAKIDLVNEILKIPNVYEFFASIKYFEWNKVNSLKEINFKDYLDAYIASNY